MRCNYFTSRGENFFKGQSGGSRYLPHAFTEQGIYMLMMVLKGDLAVRQSRALVMAFKIMQEYPNMKLTFQQTGLYHDRYIAIDYGLKSEKIYHCGASSKDAGNKTTTITRIEDNSVYHPVFNTLLKNPPLVI